MFGKYKTSDTIDNVKTKLHYSQGTALDYTMQKEIRFKNVLSVRSSETHLP